MMRANSQAPATVADALRLAVAGLVQAVLDALGKRHGPEDTRTDAQRWHDALQLGCELPMPACILSQG